MGPNSIDGKNAELMVAGYLRKQGLIIPKMNYHSRYGEIDIIAESHTELIFVEVKMRSENALFSPREAVDYNKQKKIILTAQDYISKAHEPDLQPRFDVAEVFKIKGENGEPVFKIHYIKNAFGTN